MIKKKKIIIVGAFQSKRKVFGGITTSCKILMESEFSKRFNIITVDSTQISTPPPGVLIRGTIAIRRTLFFVVKLLYYRPDGVLVFTASGGSFIEKSIMLLLSRSVKARTFIFPRAGSLITQTKESKLMFFLTKKLLKSADVFISQGASWSDFAVDQMGFDKENVYIVPNWTASDYHLSIGSTHSVTDRGVNPNIIFVGWLEEFKGVFDLVQVALNLKDKGYKFKLTFVGSGSAENKLKSIVDESNLSNIVNFSGWLDSEDLSTLFSENDIFVLPSWNEGMPNAMIEAMACGLAVIVTNVGMIPDFIQDKKHALVVPPRSINLLEGALLKLILNSKFRQQIASHGYKLANDQFSVEFATGRLGDVVQERI